MSGKRTTRGVDETDLKLIRELEADARQSNARIAAKLGIPPTTAFRRLQRLLSEKIVQIRAVPDLAALGYQERAHMLINVRDGNVDTVADELARQPGIGSVLLTTGRYDIVSWVARHDSKDLFHFVRDTLGSIPHLASAESLPCLVDVKSTWALLTGRRQFTVGRWQTTAKLDSIDLALIRELEANPRSTSLELAGRIALSRTATSRRLRRLLDEGIVTVVSMPDAFALGYKAIAGLLLKVHPRSIESAADQLASDTRILHVVICAGRYDIVAWGVFANSAEMSRFIREDLGNIPAVIARETVTILRVVKVS
ncbi:MAG: Lrp/AsnC family transcriptional regulator [Chloroflexi bacterium]|nr:Lrp/AsnC family transcriptional regulator [Chloroflexota bacterium]